MRIQASSLSIACAALLVACATSASAESKYDGYLCCNLRSDGSWISDSNYAENGKRVIPAGTPASVTGHGRYRVNVRIDGQRQAIGNDYSRDLDLDTFARRYVVTEDPAAKIATWPAKVQEAVRRAKITPGMTREQVITSLGYPISSENPDLDAPLWRYWLSSFAEFQVLFDGSGRVRDISTDANTRNLVWVP
ncbi:outer membrane protein assembly factor BamE [Luteimonas sp. S4-F44]|uniref:outer membrane protein assembly factor BamE domain-containing protein n=1 Tax=Luteimonas sp. S4-F44 TaxID=2925842 RepID=UPI001F53A2CD|nr:outer membrane protein assembly factor BamE [Luteimonas sp. S4-F44]UNK42328.1 outer membrane protein assembly factor BamE [Luteimonas sp. S4-F44]